MIELSAERYAGPQDLSRSLRSNLLRDRRRARRTLSPGPAGTKATELWRHLERKLPDGFAPRHQWLWILPAGAVPAPDALAQLEERLFTVKDEETHRAIQIIGAKQVHREHPERLVDVGLWTARSGEVLSLTEPKELDQGQYDGRDEVPAVSAHGMLVHAPLFGDLGGFDPALDAEYAAARLCGRAREVGAHVVVEPSARILREDPPLREEVHRLGGSLHLPAEQRRSQIRGRLASANPLAVPFLWVGMWGAALLRLLGLTAFKAPDAGVGQLVGAAAALLGWGAIAHTRSFRVQGRRAVLTRLTRDQQIEDEKATVASGRAEERAMRLTSEQLGAHRRRLLTAETVVHGRGAVEGAGGEEALLSIGDAGGEFDEMPSRGSGDRLVLFLVLLGLTGLSLLAFRDLLTAGALTGGAALPVSESLGEVWRSTVSFIAPQGLGERAAADPFTLILLLISAVSFGHASAVLVWLVVLALPLAALTAWYAAGIWTSTASTRIVAALLWTAVPALHVALGEGRLGVVMVHILLPLAAVALVRAVGVRRGLGGSWEYATGAALLVAVLTAAAPALLPLAVLVPAAAAVMLGRRGRPLWLVPLPSLALTAPILASALSAEKNILSVLLAEPTRALGTQESAGPAALWQQLLGHAQAFDPAAGLAGAEIGGTLPDYFAGDFWALRLALVIGAPLLLVALLGIFAVTLSRSAPQEEDGDRAGGLHRTSALAAGVLLLVCLVFSFALGQIAVAEDGRTLIPGNPAPLVSVMVFCLLIAVVGTLDRLPKALPRIGGSITPITSTLLVLSVVASLGFWAVPRVLPSAELSDQPLTAMTPETTRIGAGGVRGLPATAADQGQGPTQARTLVLEAGEQGVIGELVSGQGRTLEASRAVVTAGDVPLWARPSAMPEFLGGTRGAEDEEAPAPELSAAQARLAELVAAIVTPGSEETGELMRELGVANVLVPGSGGALTDAVDTASGLTAVGATDRGMLWRASAEQAPELPHTAGMEGANTAWARIVDDSGEPVVLLPAQDRRVDVALEDLVDADGAGLDLESGQSHYLELATERANGWRAHLDGEELDVVRDPLPGESAETEEPEVWMQRFELPDTGWTQITDGQLTAEHRSPYHLPVLIAVGGLLLLVALIAVPLPRGLRLLPVVSDAELADQSGGSGRAGPDGSGSARSDRAAGRRGA